MENQPQAPITDNDEVVVVDQYDTEALKKNLTTTLEQKRHWREKAKKESEEKAALLARIKEYEDKANSQNTLPKKDETSESKGLDFDAIADSFNTIRELNSHEFDELRSEAKSLNVDPAKYIKSKAGQAHLKEIRQAQKSNDATPSPSNKVPVFNGKPVNDIFKSDAPLAEKQAAWETKLRKKGLMSE